MHFSDLDFRAVDAEGKGCLTDYDLDNANYGLRGNKLLAPVGKAFSLFATHDTNEDRKMTMTKCCDGRTR
jgi:hypothetical protein